MNRDLILKYLSEHKHELHEKYGVIRIGLFGSFARNEDNGESDIDLAVEIKSEKKNIHNFFALKRDLESIFMKNVDIGIESALKPALKKEIKHEIIYV